MRCWLWWTLRLVQALMFRIPMLVKLLKRFNHVPNLDLLVQLENQNKNLTIIDLIFLFIYLTFNVYNINYMSKIFLFFKIYRLIQFNKDDVIN